MFDSGHLSHCSEHAIYMLIYAQISSTAKKMPQPGKALLSIGKPARQAARREELMLSECRVVCYCEGDQFNSQVKIIYHGKIPTKFCTVFLVLGAAMWIRDLRSQMPLSVPAPQSHPLHIQVCRKGCYRQCHVWFSKIPSCCWLLGNFVAFKRQFSWRNYLGFNFLFVEEERLWMRQNLL